MLDVDTEGRPLYEDALKVAAGRHDVSVINVFDPREKMLPAGGVVHIKDSETGRTAWVNTGSRKVRDSYSSWFGKVEQERRHLLNRYQIDSIDVSTDGDYVKELMKLFSGR